MGTDDGTDDAPPARTGSAGDSLTDKAQRPVVKDCVRYAAALFAVAAVALAAFVLLLDVVDQDTLGVSTGGIDQELTDDATIADGVAFFLPFVIGVVGIVGSAFVGALFGWLLREDDDTATISAAASAFVGVFVLWVLGGLLGAIFTELSEELGDLVVNGVLAGIAAAVAAGGGVRATRSLLPAALDPRRRREVSGGGRNDR